ncbi:DUF6945 domain-containing protein [Escherichia coli]|uniref:DUF6945 domain-containing protein n=1 Tax=Enterobacter ludwigii TaxID=299767 RepID=UPI001C8BA890|nr:hypothetical protein [Enterobacter ludwigii]HDT3136339.1 hypothetical protein [Enterobacter asburiae]MBX8878030.1 hypothetical protein [Enterobacter ludwigii]HDR2562157.1 hypothetical protein [Enterobacter ludwigii]HDR2580113.1 hypothetical protein [Enterobacter ludwigii]HEO9233218.1 hypothetical protein [Enterobacter asburiae]
MSTNDTEFYFTNFKRLQYATHIVRRDTGEEIKSFKEIAGIYGYMRDQYESYSKKKLEFFESLESIGLHFHGMDRRTVKKFIDVLNAIGLVNSVKQKQKDYGYDRYHHTVIPLEKIADNLIFYGPETMSGGPLAEGMLIRGLEKKKPRGKPKSKKVAQPESEESENGAQSVTVAPVPATNDSEQQSGVSQPAGDSSDDVPANDAVNHDDITIFDENGVVTEEFINALSGDAAPNRNDDGTLKKYGFAYAMAQAYQAHREGKSEEEIQRSIPVWIEAALPEYIPVHLLPKEHRAEPKPEPVHDLSNEPIPF